MSASLDALVAVRSQAAQTLATYYEALIATRDRTPWYRSGQSIPASTIALPGRVLKEVTAPPIPGRGPRDGGEGRDESAARNLDPELAALYEEPTGRKRRETVVWADEQHNIRLRGRSKLTQLSAGPPSLTDRGPSRGHGDAPARGRGLAEKGTLPS